jgi:ribosomal 30S subunit maturation factor RimM
LPNLAADEYYWYQLEGLKVINQDEQLFGKVDHLLETGANDVMVVKPAQAAWMIASVCCPIRSNACWQSTWKQA